MSDETYIYGRDNGSSYTHEAGSLTPAWERETRTHWDPRLEIRAIADTVEIGIVPPTSRSTDAEGMWDAADGQFLTLSRDGLNRLIKAVREMRDEAYGADQ